jgi:predicted GH43/DUF377 family glycosyl hydrolase
MRFKENPLITPSDIKPTRSDFEVLAVLNPAVTMCNGEIILLMRVAERPKQEAGYISVGVLDITGSNGDYKILRFKNSDPLLKSTDPRIFTYDGITYLTSMSHLRIARSKDGHNFTVDPMPFVWPHGENEEHGCEDARITRIDDTYYIYYVAVCRNGFSTVLATTKDFKTFNRMGIIFPAVNKDVAIFPETINGRFYALTRPDTGTFARPAMWIASSPDLTNWGGHQFLMGTRPGLWDCSRIGAGTVPVKTDRGWLEIYHGADSNHRYCLGIILLDLNDPGKVLFRSEKSLLEPTATYEKSGFFPDVVFTNGMAPAPSRPQTQYLYYGAADNHICGISYELDELIKMTS